MLARPVARLFVELCRHRLLSRQRVSALDFVVSNLGFHVIDLDDNLVNQLAFLGLSVKFIPATSLVLSPSCLLLSESDFSDFPQHFSPASLSLSAFRPIGRTLAMIAPRGHWRARNLLQTYVASVMTTARRAVLSLAFDGPPPVRNLSLGQSSFATTDIKNQAALSRVPPDLLALSANTSDAWQFVSRIVSRHIKRTTLLSGNISRSCADSLRLLRRQSEIVIKPADKNLGLTACSRTWYLSQVDSHLADRDVYLPLSENDARAAYGRVGAEIRNFCVTFKLPDKLSSFLCSCIVPDVERLSHGFARFYVLPKLHKSPVSSRPIVAAHSFVTTPLSRLCAALLQDLVDPNVVLQDSRALIRFLLSLDVRVPSKRVDEDGQPRRFCLVTFDVNSLYPSMTHVHKQDLFTAICARQTFRVNDTELPSNALCRACELVLANMLIRFGNRYYKQVRGTAMGTPLAPQYANISVGSRLRRVAATCPAPIVFIKSFIDDGIALLFASDRENELFLNTVKRTLDISISSSVGESVEFLDLHLTVDAHSGRIVWRTHQKLLNAYLYLPFSSRHPFHQRVSFVFGEFVRYARTCSSFAAYANICGLFLRRLHARGFSAQLLVRLVLGCFARQLTLCDAIIAATCRPSSPLLLAWKRGQQQVVSPTAKPSTQPTKLGISLPFVSQRLAPVERALANELSATSGVPIRVVSSTLPSFGKLLSGEPQP